nr:hypothetical protein [Tanacetum cinerariifolium]
MGRGGGGQDFEVCDTSRTASVVAVPPVMCAGLPNIGNVNGVGTSPLRSGLNLNLSLGRKDRYKVRIGTWNVGTLTGRSRELAEVLKRRRVNICCVQETKWKGEKAKEIGEGYKIIYSGRTSTRNGVGVILDEDMKINVVEVDRK